MEGEVGKSKRFFKVMMFGFLQKLNLPQAFCEKLKLDKSKQAVVTSPNGTWKIEICRDLELGLVCFREGWPNFVHEHGLEVGDIVVFEHTGNFHFNATVFGPNACEKDYFVADVKKEPKDAPKKGDEKGCPVAVGTSYQTNNPYFVLTMKPYLARQKALVCIPAMFWRSHCIWDETNNVVLRDPSGRKWEVKLLFVKGIQCRCRMTMGWYEFYEGNKLKNGDVCVFELVRKNPTNLLLDVQIFAASSSQTFVQREAGVGSTM